MRNASDSGWYVSGKFQDQKLEWLVDTGSTPTLIAMRCYEHLPDGQRPPLRPYNKNCVSADNSPVKVYGQVEFSITVGTKTVNHNVLVGEITNEGILGVDFMIAHGLVLDFAANSILCDGKPLVANLKQGTDQVCRVALAESTVVPAG